MDGGRGLEETKETRKLQKKEMRSLGWKRQPLARFHSVANSKDPEVSVCGPKIGSTSISWQC